MTIYSRDLLQCHTNVAITSSLAKNILVIAKNQTNGAIPVQLPIPLTNLPTVDDVSMQQGTAVVGDSPPHSSSLAPSDVSDVAV